MRRKNKKSRKSVYEIVTEQIVEKLRDGVVPWRRPWKSSATIARSYDGRQYRGVNVFLTLLSGRQGPWITMRRANELGGKIRKGEKSQIVVFWRWVEKTERNENGKEEKKSFPLLRYYRVFSLDQCENVPTPKWLEKEREAQAEKAEEIDPIESAEKIWTGYAGKPELRNGGDRAAYSPSLDYIAMPSRNDFESSAEYYSTLFHEATHSTGHWSRVGRFKKDEFIEQILDVESYSKEELIAEMGAAFLCAEAGIEDEKAIDNSAAYVANWLRRLEDDPKLVVCAAAAAQKAVDHVLGREFEKGNES